MAGSAPASTATGKKWKGSRVDVYFGKIKTRLKKGGPKVDREYVVKVKPEVQEELNLPIATPDQKMRLSSEGEGSRKVRFPGCVGGKNVSVPSPTGEKTAKGTLKRFHIPVPSNATIDEIEAFLKPTKAKSFSVKGGRSYSIAK